MCQLSKWKQPNRKGEWVTSIDLRHLFSCPNSSTIPKIYEISNKKRVFQFRALPFVVATAPLEFTRIVKEVKLIAQARNLRIHQYLENSGIHKFQKDSDKSKTCTWIPKCDRRHEGTRSYKQSGPFTNRYSTKFAKFGTHQW